MPIARVLEPELMDDPTEAAEYDAMDHAAVNAAFVADFLSTFDGASPGLVVDAGAGTALIAIELARRSAATVLALDAAESMLSLAVENVRAAGLAGRVIPTRGNIRGIPLPAGAADAVVCNTVLHHLADPVEAVRDFVRVLRPGGTLFIRDLYRPDTQVEVERLVALHAADATPTARKLFADSLPAGLTLDEARQTAAAAGLDATVEMTSDRHWTLVARA